MHYLFCPGGAFPAGFRFGADTGGGAGAGAGAGGGNSPSPAGPPAAELGGAVTAGAADDGGTTGAAVIGTGFVSDCAGSSPSLSTAVTVPKPMRNAATHASGSKTARLPIR